MTQQHETEGKSGTQKDTKEEQITREDTHMESTQDTKKIQDNLQ